MSSHYQRPGCPRCGWNDALVSVAWFAATCLRCGWTGRVDELGTREEIVPGEEGDDDTAA